MAGQVERPTWTRESFQKTFTREEKPHISSEEISKKDRISAEEAEFRAARLNLSEEKQPPKIDNLEKSVVKTEDINFDKVAPFSSVTKSLLEIGFIEQLVKEDEKVTKRLTFAANIATRLTPFSELQILDPEENISTRFISQDDINTGLITLPIDAWNLSNFNEPHYRDEGQFRHTFLNIANRAYEKLQEVDEAAERSNICISKSEKQIIILPKIRKDDHRGI